MLPDEIFELAMSAPTQVTCKGCGSVYERRTHEVMVRVRDEELLQRVWQAFGTMGHQPHRRFPSSEEEKAQTEKSCLTDC